MIDATQLNPQWEAYRHFFTGLDVLAKTILLREGEIARQAYYIQKGCLRLWFNDNGKDITFQFFFEGQGVSSMESFRTGRPSLFNLETLEPCSLLPQIDIFFDNIAEAGRFGRMIKRWTCLKGVTLITTMNTSGFLYRLIFGNAIKKAVFTGTFWKMGYGNRKWINFSKVKFVSDEKRKTWLTQLDRRFSRPTPNTHCTATGQPVVTANA
jgi:hypothetical protein